MGLFSFLKIGKEAGDAIATPIEAIGNVLDKLFTSDDEKAAAKAVMEKIKQHPMELQVEINKIEAAHTSWFVAGWRPFIGWICGLSLGTYYIPQFTMASFLWVRQCLMTSALVPYPIQNVEGLLELVLAMLGLAVYRTVEKVTGTSK